MKDLLIKLNACEDAREWAADKTCQELYDTCERGNWLLWLFSRTNPDDLQLLTLAKGHIVNTVRHLMKDGRSIKAVDVAIAFGEGKATREELESAAAFADVAYDDASDAYAAHVDADSAYAYYVIYAATAAAYYAVCADFADAADAAASDASFAAAHVVYAAADAVRKCSLKQSADIVRKYIPIDKWNVNN